MAVMIPRAAEGSVCKSQQRFCSKGLRVLRERVEFFLNECMLITGRLLNSFLSGQGIKTHIIFEFACRCVVQAKLAKM